jgi:hypothetical protein
MIKRRGGSQSESLTLNHKSLESKAKIMSSWSMLCTVGKIFSRAIKYYPFNFKKDLS